MPRVLRIVLLLGLLSAVRARSLPDEDDEIIIVEDVTDEEEPRFDPKTEPKTNRPKKDPKKSRNHGEGYKPSEEVFKSAVRSLKRFKRIVDGFDVYHDGEAVAKVAADIDEEIADFKYHWASINSKYNADPATHRAVYDLQQQNALQRDAEGLALLEKRLLDLEAGLARREAEVEAAEREIGAAQKRAREQDEAEKEAKRPRGGEELPGEGGVPLMPAELMPGLPRARAEEIFLAFDEQDPGFWAGLGPTLQRELGSLEDEREVMRDVLRVELLPERVRQARRRFTAQFKAAPKSVPPRARGRGGFAAWGRRVAVFEGGATSKKTTAQRASIVASLTRFTAVAGLQAAPPALRIKAFATAMLGKGMTQEQLEAYVARVPGQRGRPRTGEMRTASVGKYVEVLGAKLGVPSGDLAAMKKAILKARLERREVPAHAPPITLEQQRTLVEGLVRGGDEQVTVAACLAWAGALRMADLRALAPTDVVIVGPGLLRVSWWTTKEASLRMRESEVTYRVPLGVALRVSRWVQRGARFTEATTRKLLREARKLFPVCAEHSWKRGALQHLARSGAGWEDLLLMARHQSKDTLKRYLWGCLTPDSVRTARASLLLHTPVSGDLMACSR
ncbi:hypothetical protein DIPPA_31734 [Diplonema papillatum]|nr:hypothetical protein DIPPA_31734 [Diplonema papillatum]